MKNIILCLLIFLSPALFGITMNESLHIQTSGENCILGTANRIHGNTCLTDYSSVTFLTQSFTSNSKDKDYRGFYVNSWDGVSKKLISKKIDYNFFANEAVATPLLDISANKNFECLMQDEYNNLSINCISKFGSLNNKISLGAAYKFTKCANLYENKYILGGIHSGYLMLSIFDAHHEKNRIAKKIGDSYTELLDLVATKDAIYGLLSQKTEQNTSTLEIVQFDNKVKYNASISLDGDMGKLITINDIVYCMYSLKETNKCNLKLIQLTSNLDMERVEDILSLNTFMQDFHLCVQDSKSMVYMAILSKDILYILQYSPDKNSFEQYKFELNGYYNEIGFMAVTADKLYIGMGYTVRLESKMSHHLEYSLFSFNL